MGTKKMHFLDLELIGMPLQTPVVAAFLLTTSLLVPGID